MTISEEKMRIVIDNYFKSECDVNTSIRQAFDKGFRIGVKKGQCSQENKAEWILDYRDGGVEFYHCSNCKSGRAVIDGDYYKSLDEFKKCPICGVDMRGEQDG